MTWSCVACLGESGVICNGGRDIYKGRVTSPQKLMSSILGYSEVITCFDLSYKSAKTELNALVPVVSPLSSSTDEIIQ